MEQPQNHRLCHVIKRADFQGYGFHLHAEKGKAGQFIGKVDPNSPAEEAGLLSGDRIVEVNSVRIDAESHREVVERIKALEHEVKLLVIIDPKIELVKTPTTPTTTENNSKSPVVEKKKELENGAEKREKAEVKKESTTSASDEPSRTTEITTTTTTSVPDGVVKQAKPVPPPVVPVSPKTNGTKVETTTTKPSPPSLETSAVKAEMKNGGSITAISKADKDDLSDLSLSVAEIRAKLATKKKVDPKRESVDLRKKYEIVQLL